VSKQVKEDWSEDMDGEEVIVRPKYPRAKATSSWVFAILGIIIGVSGLTTLAEAGIETEPGSPSWLTSRFAAAGAGLLGLVFLMGSFAALRNRRRAAIVFVAASPIVAFLLAYPSAGLFFTDSGGAIYYLLPGLAPAIVLGCIFFAPFLTPLAAIRNRKRAAVLCLVLSSVLALAVAIMRKTDTLLLPLAAWSSPFLVFAAFWWGTHKLAWPELLSPTRRSRGRRLMVLLGECLLIAVACLTAVFGLAIMRSSAWLADCSGATLYTRPLGPNHAAFTVRFVHVGHSAKVSGKWAGTWGIGLVQESYWGLPKWSPHFVLVTKSVFWEGKTFFVSGLRSYGLLTGLLPMIDATPCGALGAHPLAESEIQLRLLRKPRQEGEHRIIGYARNPTPGTRAWRPTASKNSDAFYESTLTRPPDFKPLPGARIRLNGPQGSTVYAADQEGIYNIGPLPPDDYTLRILDLPAHQSTQDYKVEKEDLIRLGLLQLDLYTIWDGSIEGNVKDTTGQPAVVDIELRTQDGLEISPDSGGVVQKDGSFWIANLPPEGRYSLVINPYGPNERTPYATMYYPSALRREDRTILEVTPEKRHLRDVNFTVHALVDRALPVRVRWPDGRTAEQASVRLAYEHSSEWDDVVRSAEVGFGDGKEPITIHVFGDSRVRVIAEAYVGGELDQRRMPLPHRSSVVELDTTKLPRSLDLTITTSPRRTSP